MSIFDGLPDLFTESLGEPVTYTPQGGVAVTINAIEIQNSEISPIIEAPASIAIRTLLHVRTEDVPNLAAGDTFDLPAKSFRVAGTFRAAQPIIDDGHGMTAITLEATT